jgi:ATP synthase protein I
MSVKRDKDFGKIIGSKANRKYIAEKQARKSVWFGLGMFGLVGWAVAIPTLIGIAIGIWLDKHHPVEGISWSMSLLLVGIILGCLNAWRWVSKERRLESSDNNRRE